MVKKKYHQLLLCAQSSGITTMNIHNRYVQGRPKQSYELG